MTRRQLLRPLLRAALLAVAIVGASMATVPSVAGATSAPQEVTPNVSCPAHITCMYQNTNYGGQRYLLATSDKTFANNYCDLCTPPGAWSTKMSSIINNHDVAYCFYYNYGYGKPELRVNANDRKQSVGQWNDHIRSAKPCG